MWNEWIASAEWWYNTTYRSSINASPSEVLSGYPPPIYMPYVAGNSKVAEVDRVLTNREGITRVTQFYLQCAQNRMKQYADSRRSEREFEVDERAFLKLQPYRQHSLQRRSNQKLSPLYYGPCRVLQRIGSVAYKLELPVESLIHLVFHVSQLKKTVMKLDNSSSVLPKFVNSVERVPVPILDRRMVKRNNRAVSQWLIKWSDGDESEATWEFVFDLQKRYPGVNLMDKLAKGKGIVTDSNEDDEEGNGHLY